MEFIAIIVTYVFVSNFVLTQFLGLCPFIGVSKNVESAIGMGFAVTFVMTLAAAITWLINALLVFANVEFLQTIAFILVIAALVQLVEMVVQKISQPLYKALGIFLPLITTNCAVLGLALINIQKEYDFFQSVVAGFAAGIGFLLALLMMSIIREKLDTEWIPKSFRGAPIAFISGGLMALAFMAFGPTLVTKLFGA